MEEQPKRISARELAHLIADSIAEDLASFRIAGSSSISSSNQRSALGGPASPAIGARRAALQNWARRSASLLSAFLAAISSDSFGAPEPGLWASDQAAQSSALQQNLNFLGTFWGAIVNRKAPRAEVEHQLAIEAAEAVRIADETAANDAGIPMDQFLTSSERDARSLGTLLQHSLAFRLLQARAYTLPTCSIALHPHHLIVSLYMDEKRSNYKNRQSVEEEEEGDYMSIALGVSGEGRHSAWSVTGLSWGAHGSIGVIKDKSSSVNTENEGNEGNKEKDKTPLTSEKDKTPLTSEFLIQCMKSLQQSLNNISAELQQQVLLTPNAESVVDRSLSELHAAALDLAATTELRKSFLLLINASPAQTLLENTLKSIQLIKPSYITLMPRSKRMIISFWGPKTIIPRTIVSSESNESSKNKSRTTPFSTSSTSSLLSSSTLSSSIANSKGGIFHRVPSVLFINNDRAVKDCVVNLVPIIRSSNLKPVLLFSILTSLSPDNAMKKLLTMPLSLSTNAPSLPLSSQSKVAEIVSSNSDSESAVSRASVIEEAPVSQLMKDMREISKNSLIESFIGDAASPHLTNLFISHGTSSFVLGPAPPPQSGILQIDIAQAQAELADKLSFCHLLSFSSQVSSLSSMEQNLSSSSISEFSRSIPKSLIARKKWWLASGKTNVPSISSLKSTTKATEVLTKLQLNCINTSISAILETTLEFLNVRPDFVKRTRQLSPLFISKMINPLKLSIECPITVSKETPVTSVSLPKVTLSVTLEPINGFLQFEVMTHNVPTRVSVQIAQVIAAANEVVKTEYNSKTQAMIAALCSSSMSSLSLSSSSTAVNIENSVSLLVATGSEYVLQSLSKISSDTMLSSEPEVSPSSSSTYQLPWTLRKGDSTGRGSHVFGGPLLIERDLSIHAAVNTFAILRARSLAALMAPIDSTPDQLKRSADQIAQTIFTKTSKEEALLNAVETENKKMDEEAWRTYGRFVDSSIRSKPVAGLSELSDISGALLPGRAAVLAKLVCESRLFAERLDAVGSSEMASRNNVTVICSGAFIADALLNTLTEAIECFNFLSTSTETAQDEKQLLENPKVFVFSEETVFLSSALIPIEAPSTSVALPLGRVSEIQRISPSIFQYTVSDPRLPSHRKSYALIARPVHISTSLSIRDSGHVVSSSQSESTSQSIVNGSVAPTALFTFPNLLQLNRVKQNKLKKNTQHEQAIGALPLNVGLNSENIECQCEWLPKDLVDLFNSKVETINLPSSFRFVSRNIVSKPPPSSNEGVIYIVELSTTSSVSSTTASTSSSSSSISKSSNGFSSSASFLNRKMILEDAAFITSEDYLKHSSVDTTNDDNLQTFLSTLGSLFVTPQRQSKGSSSALKKEVKGIIVVDTHQDPTESLTIFAGLHLTRAPEKEPFTLPFGVLYACSGAASAVIRAANASEASAKQLLQPVTAPVRLSTNSVQGMFGSSRTIQSAPKIYNPILSISSLLMLDQSIDQDKSMNQTTEENTSQPLLVVAAVTLPEGTSLQPIKDLKDVQTSSSAKRARVVETPSGNIEKMIVQLTSRFH